MPPKLDRCVQELIKKGYSEEEAWAICKKSLKKDLQMKYEHKKKILTGQLITGKYLKEKEKELEESE